ncbi:MAG: MFS transporter, partial [Desulfovibrio sp.]
MPNLLLLALLAAFPALSTDMYLPAIPRLERIWGISLSLANLSLVAFFASFSLFLLVHGPLSDRFGRRPVLLWGILLFIAGSLACALAPSIGALITARIVQAAGAAAASSLSLALSKDLYSGLDRQRILAYLAVI